MEVSDLNLADGEYTVEVTMEGGSGRASVQSPTELSVENGQAEAKIVWCSSHYDYMKVGEEKYLPVNTEGNSRFEIPVEVFDEPMSVIGDTTAMSVPHEIEYTLTFASDSVSPAQSGHGMGTAGIGIAAAVVIACAAAFWGIRKNKKKIG